jgi:hypothetical protein
MSFGALHCSLPPHDGFLFLAEPLNLLLDSRQLLFLCYCFFFFSFFIPIVDLEVIKLCVPWKRVCQRRCSRE